MPYGSLTPGLNNNKNLLRKKSLFRRERTFLNLKKEYLKAADGKLDYKKASKEELLAIRKKIMRRRKKKEIVVATIYLFFVSLILYFVFTLVQQENVLLQNQQSTSLSDKTNNEKKQYAKLIKDGDQWSNKGNINNAIFQYKKARDIVSNNYELNYKLVRAYYTQCQTENENCKEAQVLLNQLLLNFPNKEKELSKIKAKKNQILNK